MSNPIKKNHHIDGSVKIGEVTFENLSVGNQNGENRYNSSLDFRSTIEKETNNWRKKLEQKSASMGTSIEQKIQEAFIKGSDIGKKKEQSEREKYISEHYFVQFGIINNLLNETKQKNLDALRGLEEKIVNLSISIAEKIINTNLKSNPKLFENIIRESMTHMITGEIVVMRISPQDFEVINFEYEKWHGITGNVKSFKIEADKRLSIGDCIIESEGGIVDATMHSRLEIIAEELLKINR